MLINYIQEKIKDKNLKTEYKANMNHLLGTFVHFMHKTDELQKNMGREKISNHIYSII